MSFRIGIALGAVGIVVVALCAGLIWFLLSALRDEWPEEWF